MKFEFECWTYCVLRHSLFGIEWRQTWFHYWSNIVENWTSMSVRLKYERNGHRNESFPPIIILRVSVSMVPVSHPILIKPNSIKTAWFYVTVYITHSLIYLFFNHYYSRIKIFILAIIFTMGINQINWTKY